MPHHVFIPNQLAHGVYYGAREDGRLVAAGGTYVLSASAGVAAIGGIYTRPVARQKGYATAITSSVVADLLAQGCDNVVLNVKPDNTVAKRIYERLGFREHCQFTIVEAERKY